MLSMTLSGSNRQLGYKRKLLFFATSCRSYRIEVVSTIIVGEKNTATEIYWKVFCFLLAGSLYFKWRCCGGVLLCSKEVFCSVFDFSLQISLIYHVCASVREPHCEVVTVNVIALHFKWIIFFRFVSFWGVYTYIFFFEITTFLIWR